MAESGMFRSSLHGFNRQDVLRYIEELQAANSEREESLSAQLEAALSEAETLRSEASALRASSEETAAHAADLHVSKL